MEYRTGRSTDWHRRRGRRSDRLSQDRLQGREYSTGTSTDWHWRRGRESDRLSQVQSTGCRVFNWEEYRLELEKRERIR